VFKILDKTKEKGALTTEMKASRRSEITGRVCHTYKRERLQEIAEYLEIKDLNKITRIDMVCIYIELALRINDAMRKDSRRWFYRHSEKVVPND
jgi:hypothetical protein